MRRAFPWLLLGAGFATLVALVLFGAPAGPPSTHSSTSDAADGTSALYRAAANGGHPVSRSPGSPALIFLFSPNEPYTNQEANGLYGFVSRGGTLVYASEQADPAIERRFELVRPEQEVRDVVAYPPGPLLDGVHEVSGGAAAQPFIPLAADQVPILRGPLGEILGLEERVGRGLLVALADPLPLCNGYILRSDNARFAADILGTAPPGGAIAFDESHHAPTAAPAPAVAPAPAASPWIYAVLWAVAAGYVGLALRGRAFGPPIPLAPPRARSTAEYVDAVGTLLRRAGGSRQAAELLLTATRRSLSRRLGGHNLPPDRLQDLLERRRPELAQRLAAAEQAAAAAEHSEPALLQAAQNLHELDQFGGRP